MRIRSTSVILLIAWGALAFGAEYTWAYAPLFVLCAVTGVLGLKVTDSRDMPPRVIVAGLALLVLMAALSTLSLPLASRVNRVSQSVDFDALRASLTSQPLPLEPAQARISIAPDRTLLGLVSVASLALLFAGTARAFSRDGLVLVTRGIVATGAGVALLGIIQANVRAYELYGFWRPPKGDVSFAPFINENHFAGWMVMALALSIGWLAGELSRSARRNPPRWRSWLRWLFGSSAGDVVLTTGALGLMVLSIVATRSRGGLVGLGVLMAGSFWLLIHRKASRSIRLAGGVGLLVLGLVAALRGGIDLTLEQFGGASLNWGGRKQVWLDTLRIIHDYPWTGTGLNTYGIAMLHYQTMPRGEYFIEAHNDYLQLAAEGGLLLGIPILITIALFIREVRKRFQEGADDERTYWLRAGAVTGLISIAVMEIFDFTLQMPGAAVLFVVLAAIAIHKPHYLARRREARAHRE